MWVRRIDTHDITSTPEDAGRTHFFVDGNAKAALANQKGIVPN
jgi:hypothetical protein